MRRFLPFLLAGFLLSSSLPFPVLDPFGAISCCSGLFPFQTSGIFYNPALSLSNYPALLYSRGSFSFDLSNYLSMGEEGEINREELAREKSYVFKVSSFIMQGRGGAFAYVKRQTAVVEPSAEQDSFSLKIEERSDFIFNYSRYLMGNRLIFGSSLKYSRLTSWEDERPLAPFSNRYDLLEPEGEGTESKKLFWDAGLLFMLNPRIWLALSALDMEALGEWDLTPRHLYLSAAAGLTASTLISAGADLRNYRNDYSFGAVQRLGRAFVVGANMRRLYGNRLYSLYGSIKMGGLFLSGSFYFKNEKAEGFLFGIGIVEDF